MRVPLPITPVLQLTTLNNCMTAHFPYPFYFKGEYHPFWEMIYARADGFQVASSEKVYTMRKGDVIFHKPMEFHRLWTVDEPDARAYIVGFCAEGEVLQRLADRAFTLDSRQQAQLEEIMTYASTVFPRTKHRFIKDYMATMARDREVLSVKLQIFAENTSCSCCPWWTTARR